MIRRLVALLLAFATIQLGVARGDASCVTHSHDAPTTGHEGMHDAGAPADATPCDRPVTPACCHAATPCGLTVALDEGSDRVTARVAGHLRVAVAVAEHPLSRSTAPEPPPPKA